MELPNLWRLMPQGDVDLSQPRGPPRRAWSGIQCCLLLAVSSLAGTSHPCQVISVSDTCYRFLRGQYHDVKKVWGH